LELSDEIIETSIASFFSVDEKVDYSIENRKIKLVLTCSAAVKTFPVKLEIILELAGNEMVSSASYRDSNVELYVGMC